MQLLRRARITAGASELEMQKQVDEFLKNQQFRRYYENFWQVEEHIALREFRVPEVRRISDHVVLVGKRRVINFECKLTAIDEVIKQATDHLSWCDYSLIVVPPDVNYITNSHLQKIMKNGLGLVYWFRDIGMFEFIFPKFNRSSDKELRSKIINRILDQTCELELNLKTESK